LWVAGERRRLIGAGSSDPPRVITAGTLKDASDNENQVLNRARWNGSLDFTSTEVKEAAERIDPRFG
jgi:hypothetical protein